jgi:hypothetical protein
MDENKLRSQRRAVLVFLYVLSLLLGAYTGVTANLPPTKFRPDFAVRVDLLLAILVSLGFMWFCSVDAKLAGKPLIQLAKLGIFLGWPIGVPLYLLWARGLRGLVTLVLHGFLLLLLLVVSMLVTGYLVYGDAFPGPGP